MSAGRTPTTRPPPALDSVQLAPGSFTLVLTYAIAGRRATLRQNVRVVKRPSPAPSS